MKYAITIRATVTKTYTVDALSEAEAEIAAHEAFTVNCDDTDEDYDQITVDVEAVKGETA
jgi:phage protein D